jgi:hypothetical protein
VTTAHTALVVATGAAGAAAVLLIAVVVLALRLRRVRRDQRRLLGTADGDIVEYAVALLARVEAVETRMHATTAGIEGLRRELRGSFSRRALVRYDALEGAGGRQSVSVALLDAASCGFVISAIQGRDYARIYVKQIRDGESDFELSPEERSVLRDAVAS